MSKYRELEEECQDDAELLESLVSGADALRMAYARRDPKAFTSILQEIEFVGRRLDFGLQSGREEIARILADDGYSSELDKHDNALSMIERHALRVFEELRLLTTSIANSDKKFARKIRI